MGAVMPAGIANPRFPLKSVAGKRSRHSRRMRDPQFYGSGKRSMRQLRHIRVNGSHVLPADHLTTMNAETPKPLTPCCMGSVYMGQYDTRKRQDYVYGKEE